MDDKSVSTIDKDTSSNVNQDRYEAANVRTLEAEADRIETNTVLNKQRVELRKKAYGLAQGVIGGIALFLFVVAFVVIITGADVLSPQAQVAAITAPIAAMSIITVFLLKGVFAGLAAKEESNGLVPGVVSDVVKETIS